jgi:hypothetical protein
MKKLLLVLLFIPLMSIGQIQETFFDEGYVTFKTPKGEIVDVDITYRTNSKNKAGEVLDNETILKLIKMANAIVPTSLKSRRSYVPLTYGIVYKWNKKGKHKYGVNVSYEGTNSYGGAVEDMMLLEFNAKFKETAGSLMMRM